MLKDMINISLLQKGQNDRIMNIVFVFYGIQGVGHVLRTSVCANPTVLEAEVLWSGLEFVMMVALSSKLFKDH
jgi:hypothetical protein